jgi:hypothetical protein
VRARNPRCDDDVLTDRWPENLDAQGLFIADLKHLVAQLRKLDGADLEDARVILADLFGEIAGTQVLKFAEANAAAVRDGRSAHVPGAGRFAVTGIAAGSAATPTRAEPTKPHRFFGGDATPWKRR